jgi:hypothetical protein
MSLHPTSRKFVEDFFAALAPYETAFQHIGFSYLAVKFGEPFQIVRARIFLNTSQPTAPPPHFKSTHVRAGNYPLTELGFDLRGLIDHLVTDILETPDGPLHFPSAPGGHHAASFTPFHPDGLTTQTRYNVLTIMAGATGYIRQPEIDWEIKAASRPYEGLQELAHEFGLGILDPRPPYVEVIAYNVAVIDAQHSTVSGNSAHVQVNLAKGLEHKRVKVGYRAYAAWKTDDTEPDIGILNDMDRRSEYRPRASDNRNSTCGRT